MTSHHDDGPASTGTRFDPAAIARDLFGVEAEIARLHGEWDLNYRATERNGDAFVLKIMRAGCDRELIELQCLALEHLAEAAPDLVLPRVRRTRNGERFATVDLGGEHRLVWMLTYVPGELLASARPRTPAMLRSLGRVLGRMDEGLEGFDHPAAHRDFRWDLARAAWVRDELDAVEDASRRGLVARTIASFERDALPLLPALRRSAIHNDANDHNVIVDGPRCRPRQVVSVIDFGDLVTTNTVCELAIGAAYALLSEADPLEAAAEVVAGYHGVCPLTPEEISILFPLIRARLCVSVTNSAIRKRTDDDPYITISEGPAWEALERLDRIHPRFAHFTFRHACGLDPVPHGPAVRRWLGDGSAEWAPVLEHDLRTSPSIVVDLSVGSLLLGADPRAAETDALTETIFRRMDGAGVEVAIGRYDEARMLYSSPLFVDGGHPIDERRTIHLGQDLFVAEGAPVYAPIDGVVHLVERNDAPLDYGPLIVLRHATSSGETFFTLYGHLSLDSLTRVSVGQEVSKGERIASVGSPPTNGNWSPHLHFQIILDLLDLDRDFPGVAFASQRAVWTALSPDPNLVLGIPDDRFPARESSAAELLARRRRRLGPNLSVSYREPLEIVRGWMQFLYDESARAYLDLYNNVAHVGHSHPRVVEAVTAQMRLLNTNTRYLHEKIVRYAERLTERMPERLRVCYFLNSASEANELALRLARAHTGRRDTIVLASGYHGHTTTLVDVSPYKFEGPGGAGAPSWVHTAPIPDVYRGAFGRDDPDAGRRYADEVAAIVERLVESGEGPAAFLAETFPSVGGQIVPPPGYLSAVYEHVRGAGGLCIADEVQTGFGRIGTHFWGFESQGVEPDLVVLGKPIGNGFPLGAVVTTEEVAASFDNGMEFFSTFGGNPVACAAGLAVLDVLDEEDLQQRALEVGGQLLEGLSDLMPRHEIVGDVRGSGLFLGMELVRDRETREPASDEAAYVVDRMREFGILLGTDGPFHNVIKMRGPMVLQSEDVRRALELFDRVLSEDFIKT